MHYMTGALFKCYNSLLKRLLHTAQFLDSSDSAAEHAVNPVLKLMYHISGSCDNCNTFLVILCAIFIRNQQHDPVSHDRTHQTFKEILCDLTESGIEFICPHTCTYCIAQHTIFQGIPKLHYDQISVFLMDIQKLCIIILISDKIILKKNIIDISALDHRHYCFQFLPDTEIIASLLTGQIYLCHHSGTGFQDHFLIYRLGEKFLNS